MGASSSKPHEIETKYFPEFEAGLPSLEGKTVVITGTTSGTGFILARTAVRKGAANVLLLNRPSDRSQAAESRLKDEPESKSNVETIPCDLQDFSSVRKAADLIKSKYEAVDVLCNNAGVMAVEDKATKDGYDIQMQTNHLSHFILTTELHPLLNKAAELRGFARIANHSSSARNMTSTPLQGKYLGKNGGDLGGNGNSMFFCGARWQRYHQSKLANAVFTMALNDRMGGGESSKVLATCADPGAAATNLQVTTVADGGMDSGMLGLGTFMRFAQSAEDGTMPIASACFSPDAKTSSIWIPKSGMTGPAKQIPMDKLSATDSFRDLLWKASEEACGTFDL